MTSSTAWIKACLNGSRRPADHPALPLTAAALAADAAAAVAAGAVAVHIHPRDDAGAQTMDPAHVDAAVRAVRAAQPGLPVGVTTGAWIEPDPARRVALASRWRERPDFASVNFSEQGAAELARALLERGVGVEAGLWSADDARTLLASGLQERCVRFLVEPRDREPAAALATGEAILALLEGAGATPPRLLHGGGPAAWAVLREALRRGLQTRIGLEDTLDLPDGARAAGNADLVRAAFAIAAEVAAG
ncbi:MAG: hypothetical protein FJZ92_11740 [Chloroflexi bacterium]|nr:hypothetical protein [Chloroflexota bacterium]